MNIQEAIPQTEDSQHQYFEIRESFAQEASGQKQEQFQDLMTSIENKLSMLACDDDSIQDFQASKISSPKRELLTATDEKRKHPKMFINDLQLETSQRKTHHNYECHQKSKLGQSGIVSRINQMQHFYMDKIQIFSHRISSLEFDYQQLRQKYLELQKINAQLTITLNMKQEQQKRQINKKVLEIKNELITKFSSEAEEHYEKHLRQMKVLTNQLTEEKKIRRALEHEVSLIKNQKHNLEQFYKDLLHDHKQMIRVDLQNGLHAYHNCDGSANLNRSLQKNKNKEVSGKYIDSPEDNHTRKKKYKKISQKKSPQTQKPKIEFSNHEQMIPYLAQGIKQLKDKLKIK